MASWPGTLPTAPFYTGFSETLADTLVRTSMDAGPSKVRRRFTGGVRLMNMQMYLTRAQKDTLITFYDTTLVGGSVSFDTLEDFLLESGATLRFVSPPRFNSLGPNNWIVSMELEVLP